MGRTDEMPERDGVMPEQHENVSHGDILLPVNSYHCTVPDTYTELSLHWHEEMEITGSGPNLSALPPATSSSSRR